MESDAAHLQKYKEMFGDEAAAQLAEHVQQWREFHAAYKVGHCYLCGFGIEQKSKETPCIHWLLLRTRPKLDKSNDLVLISSKYGYFNIAAYLRWCANEEGRFRNINDLQEGAKRPSHKVLNSTIRWKNVEWTFDCGLSDFSGHGAGHHRLPHYHLQVRIDGTVVVKFNETHMPFSETDQRDLNLLLTQGAHISFGPGGQGMLEAMAIEPSELVKRASVSNDPNAAQFNFMTVIDAKSPVPGHVFGEIVQQAKEQGRSIPDVAHERLGDRANISTRITPHRSVPETVRRKARKAKPL